MTTQSVSTAGINIEKPKKSFFTHIMYHNAKQNIMRNLKILIIIFVLHMLAAPLTLIMAMLTISLSGQPDIGAIAGVGSLTTGIAALAGILCVLQMFSYHHQKTLVDMHHSLPMTTSQRFVSDFLSGLVLYVLPFIASSIITLILLLVGHLAYDGRSFGQGVDQLWVCNIFAEYAPMIIKLIIGGIILMLMLYSLTVLVTTCCGSTFECIAYTVLANILIPGVTLSAVYSLMSDLRGLNTELYAINSTIYFSPAGSLFGLIWLLDGEQIISAPITNITFAKWALLNLLISVIYAVGAFFLNRLRKAEDTGKPFVFSAFYYIIITAATIAIELLFLYADSDDMLIPMIVITAVMNMILAVIKNRGFKKFWKEAIRYAATVLACGIAFFVFQETNGFGIVNRIPSPSSVREVYIDYKGMFDDYNYYSYDNDFYVKITSPDIIQKITDIHGSILNSSRKSSVDSLSLTYKMKDGRIIAREYDINMQILNMLFETDLCEELRSARADKADKIIDNFFNNSRNYTELIIMPYEAYAVDELRNLAASEIPVSRFSADFSETLKSCIRSDIMNMTAEDYYTPQGGCYLLAGQNNHSSYYRDRIVFTDAYTSTISYLKECGFNFNEIDNTISYTMNYLDVAIINNSVVEKTTGLTVPSSSADLRSIGAYIPEYEGTELYRYSYLHSTCLQSRTDAMILLSNAKYEYHTDENLYVIRIYTTGNTAVIPAEYSDIAERVYINAVCDQFTYLLTMLTSNNFTDYDYDESDHYYSYYKEYSEKYYRSFIKVFLEEFSKQDIISALQEYETYDGYESELYDCMLQFANGKRSLIYEEDDDHYNDHKYDDNYSYDFYDDSDIY